MSQFPVQDSHEAPGFLSLLGIATLLVTAGVGIALFMAGG